MRARVSCRRGSSLRTTKPLFKHSVPTGLVPRARLRVTHLSACGELSSFVRTTEQRRFRHAIWQHQPDPSAYRWMSRWRALSQAREIFLRRGCSSEASGTHAQAGYGRNTGLPVTAVSQTSLSSSGRQSCFPTSLAQGYFQQVHSADL